MLLKANRKYVASRLASPYGRGARQTGSTWRPDWRARVDGETFVHKYYVHRLRMTGIDSPGQKTKCVNVRAMSTRVCACNEHQDMCAVTSVVDTMSIQFQIDLRTSSGPMIYLHVFV